jgi:hypothetical protein
MPGLVPGIHVFHAATKTWMAGTSPAMTVNVIGKIHYADFSTKRRLAFCAGRAFME